MENQQKKFPQICKKKHFKKCILVYFFKLMSTKSMIPNQKKGRYWEDIDANVFKNKLVQQITTQ